jgi:hypothetical protein
MLIKPLPKSEEKNDETLNAPEDQAWLEDILYDQTKILKSINTAVQIIAVLILLSVIVAACSALLT